MGVLKKMKKAKIDVTENDHRFLNFDPKNIKNKIKRDELRKKQSTIKNKKKLEKRQKNKNNPNYVPKTPLSLDTLREKDETITDDTRDIQEGNKSFYKILVREEEEFDEFEKYFKDKKDPKILFTTGIDYIRKKRPSHHLLEFIENLVSTFPNSSFYRRKSYEIKEIQQFAINREYTDLILVKYFL
jgi:ribosome production factor 1